MRTKDRITYIKQAKNNKRTVKAIKIRKWKKIKD